MIFREKRALYHIVFSYRESLCMSASDKNENLYTSASIKIKSDSITRDKKKTETTAIKQLIWNDISFVNIIFGKAEQKTLA